MADSFGNYQANVRSLSEAASPMALGHGDMQIFSEIDYPLVDGVPSVTPTTNAAIWMAIDGTNMQWFNGYWV